MCDVLTQLGFVVAQERCGVYHVRRGNSFNGVALLFTPGDGTILLFTANLGAAETPDVSPAAIDRVMDAWAELDARRMEEAGVEAIELNPALCGKLSDLVLLVDRPEGRTRYMRLAASGELICLN